MVLLRFVGNPHVYQAPESGCFIAARAIGAHEALFHFIYIFTSEFFSDYFMQNDSGAVNRNTPHSPPVCSMFLEMAQCLKFFMFFPGVTIMTSVS